MKYTVLILVAAAVMLVVGEACAKRVATKATKTHPAGVLTHYSYYQYGSTAQAPIDFDIRLNEADTSTALLCVKGTVALAARGYDDYQIVELADSGETVMVSANVLREIAAIIIDHKMYSYKESYKPPYEVMDGYGWNLCADYAGDVPSITSGGHNAQPGDDGITLINELLQRHYLATAPR